MHYPVWEYIPKPVKCGNWHTSQRSSQGLNEKMDVTWTTTDAQQIVSFESIQENLDQFSKAELRCVDTWISLSCKKKKKWNLSVSFSFLPCLGESVYTARSSCSRAACPWLSAVKSSGSPLFRHIFHTHIMVSFGEGFLKYSVLLERSDSVAFISVFLKEQENLCHDSN